MSNNSGTYIFYIIDRGEDQIIFSTESDSAAMVGSMLFLIENKSDRLNSQPLKMSYFEEKKSESTEFMIKSIGKFIESKYFSINKNIENKVCLILSKNPYELYFNDQGKKYTILDDLEEGEEFVGYSVLFNFSYLLQMFNRELNFLTKKFNLSIKDSDFYMLRRKFLNKDWK